MSYANNALATFLLIASLGFGKIYATDYTFRVKQDHWRGPHGELRITVEGIEFQAERAQASRRWVYRDIKTIDLVSPRRLVIQTYEDPKWKLGGDRSFSFQIVEGELTDEVYQFLRARFDKPITMRLSLPAADFMYTLPVKHRHRLGGCQGILKIGKDRVIYDTERGEDRRIWFYKDIESVGSSHPLDLRITTNTETYTFELKERMPNETYEYLWERVNPVRVDPLK